MDDWFNDDDLTYNIRVSIPELDRIVQARLVEAARIIEEIGTVEDIPIWDALMVLIPYFSNPDQKVDLENWNTSPDWVKIVQQYG